MSRIWDLPPKYLCKNHLLGEHRELHGVWTVITENKKGYSNHPETKRWINKLAVLYCRHKKLVNEMISRGYNHNSDLSFIIFSEIKQDEMINSFEEQLQNIINKKCECNINGMKLWINSNNKQQKGRSNLL